MKALGGEVVLTSKDGGIRERSPRRRSSRRRSRGVRAAAVPQSFNANRTTRRPARRSTSRWRAASMPASAGSGTGGTFSGVARYLKERNPALLCVIVEPQGSVLQGRRGRPARGRRNRRVFIHPPCSTLSLTDEYITVPDDPPSPWWRGSRPKKACSGVIVRRQCRCGDADRGSAPGRKRVVTTHSPDGAERYMSKGIFSKWRMTVLNT